MIRSNASALWGNAAGGVISVSTVPVIDRPFSTLQYQSGSYGLQRYIAQTGTPIGTKGGVAYATFVNTNFDGWRVNSDARRVLLNTGIYVYASTTAWLDQFGMLFAMLGARALALMRLGRMDQAADWAVRAIARDAPANRRSCCGRCSSRARDARSS